jgi:hypothetical protein
MACSGNNTRNAEYHNILTAADRQHAGGFFAESSRLASTVHSESREFASTGVNPVQPGGNYIYHLLQH